MKAFLPLLLLVAALSGCAERPSGTPETTTPAGTAALPEPVPPVNISFDGRTTFDLCVGLPGTGICSGPPDPDDKTAFEAIKVNGTSFRITGNLTWVPTYPFKTTLELSMVIEDAETRERLSQTREYWLEGESPLTFDWNVTGLPEGVQFDLTAHNAILLEDAQATPVVLLPQDYHIEALLYDDAS